MRPTIRLLATGIAISQSLFPLVLAHPAGTGNNPISIPSSLIAHHIKRDDRNSCRVADEAGTVPIGYEPLNVKCTGGNQVGSDGHCPTDKLDLKHDCTTYCEDTRKYYYGEPFLWEPSRPPVCDSETITLEKSRTKVIDVSFGEGWAVPDPAGVLSLTVGGTIFNDDREYEEEGLTQKLKGQGKLCAHLVGIPAMVESCGYLTRCKTELPNPQLGASFGTCTCVEPETVRVCSTWEHLTSNGRNTRLNTLEYVWDTKNDEGGIAGEYAGDKYQTESYMYSSRVKDKKRLKKMISWRQCSKKGAIHAFLCGIVGW